GWYFVFDTCLFFSSRRRHTRFSRDWSSDVCSSDLRGKDENPLQHLQDGLLWERISGLDHRGCLRAGHLPRAVLLVPPANGRMGRSEERRVGKKGGSRMPTLHERKSGRRVVAVRRTM